MTEITHILYFSSKAPYSLYRVNAAGEVVETRQIKALSEVRTDNNAHLIVLIPGENVLLTRVCLPNTNRSQWHQAIPYALEEWLATDVDNCFFAIGHSDADGNIPVAVIDKQWFETVLHTLHSAGLQPDIIIPDFLALPFEESAWSVTIRGDIVSVRTGLCAGFSVDRDNVSDMLSLQEEKPSRIKLIGDGSLSIENIVIEQVAFNLDLPSPINLLQGPYQPKHRRSKAAGRWKQCLYAVSAVIFALFFSNVVRYFYLSHQSNRLSQRITTTYRKIFPNEKVVTEPRFRIAALLKRVNHTAGANHFLQLLEKTEATLRRYPHVKISALHYESQSLSLYVQADKVSTLNAILPLLSKQGLNVQQNQLQVKKSKVVAQLRIQEKAV